MAESEQKGTGHHPHKSAEEPYAHHEGQSTRSENRSESSSHRSGEHRGESSRENDRDRDREGRKSEGSQSSSESRSGSDNSDLKSREYRGSDGEVHHHTTTYMEQHGGESGSKRASGSESGRETHRSEGNKREAS